MDTNQSPILLLVALKNELETISIPKSIPVAYTGVGKINAATVAQTAIMHHQPQLIINFGTVGKINLSLSGLITDPWLLEQHIDVVDMELFAIAAVAHQHQIPWLSFKFISDSADSKAGEQWHEKINHGEELFIEQLKQLVS